MESALYIIIKYLHVWHLESSQYISSNTARSLPISPYLKRQISQIANTIDVSKNSWNNRLLFFLHTRGLVVCSAFQIIFYGKTTHLHVIITTWTPHTIYLFIYYKGLKWYFVPSNEVWPVRVNDKVQHHRKGYT